MNLNEKGKIKVIARFYDLKHPGDERSQILVLPKQNTCVCCNATGVPLIKLKECSHVTFMKLFFHNRIKLTTDLVCQYCHGFMKKIVDFKNQVEESILQRTMPNSPKPIRKLQITKPKIISIISDPLNFEKIKQRDDVIYPMNKSFKEELNINELCEYIINSNSYSSKSTMNCRNNELDKLKMSSNIISGNYDVVAKKNTEYIMLNDVKVFSTKVSPKSSHIVTNNEEANSLDIRHNSSTIVHNKNQKARGSSCDETQNKLDESIKIEVPAWHTTADDWQNGDNQPKIFKIVHKPTNEPTPQEKSIPQPTVPKIETVMLTEDELRLERESAAQDPKYLKMFHKCEYCLCGFNHEDTLNKHNMRRHDKNIGNYICIVCQTVVDSEVRLKNHMEFHCKRYQCMECNKRFKNLSVCTSHYNEVHGKDGTLHPFECPLLDCDFTTINIYEYNRHKRRTHGKRYPCTDCTKLFASADALKTHIDKVHKSIERIYKCDKCDKEYRTLGGLVLHTDVKHPGEQQKEPVICAICHQQYTTSKQLKIHLKWHLDNQEKRYQCDDCGRKFAIKKQVQMHIEYEHLKLTYPCKQCDQTYRFEISLRKHIKYKHSNQPIVKKPPGDNILCQYCGKAFKHASSLRSHIWSHKGERPLQCKLCPANFAHSAALYTHNRLVHKVPKRKMQKK